MCISFNRPIASLDGSQLLDVVDSLYLRSIGTTSDLRTIIRKQTLVKQVIDIRGGVECMWRWRYESLTHTNHSSQARWRSDIVLDQDSTTTHLGDALGRHGKYIAWSLLNSVAAVFL